MDFPLWCVPVRSELRSSHVRVSIDDRLVDRSQDFFQGEEFEWTIAKNKRFRDRAQANLLSYPG